MVFFQLFTNGQHPVRRAAQQLGIQNDKACFRPLQCFGSFLTDILTGIHHDVTIR